MADWASTVTVSIGVAEAQGPSDFHQLYRLADRALYAAKQAGRDQIAVLDKNGEIIAVNEGWTRFAEENRGQGVGVGVNYLEVCRKAADLDPQARNSLDGIFSVLNGDVQQYREEYRCDTPDGGRWFVLSVTPLRQLF